MRQEKILKQALHAKAFMGKDQLDNLEVDGPITWRIVGGIAWKFTQAKLWM